MDNELTLSIWVLVVDHMTHEWFECGNVDMKNKGDKCLNREWGWASARETA